MFSAIFIFVALCLLIIIQVNDYRNFQEGLDAVQRTSTNKLVASPLPGYYKPFCIVMGVLWLLVAILTVVGVIPSILASKWFLAAVAFCLSIEFLVLYVSAESRLAIYHNENNFFFKDRTYPFKSLRNVAKVKGRGFNMRSVELNSKQYLVMNKNAAEFLATKLDK